ncbi:MAG: hypothetical protein KY468_21190 [Armatimonadetes bacterium]|nr:hypothetical protein [Armatimonadota bacterium]
MILVPWNATEEEILERVRDWVEGIACGEVEEAFRLLTEGVEDRWQPRHLQYILSSYRSDLYPGETEFRITSWKTARTEGREPARNVTWYEPNPSFLAVIEYDVPLNGRWSDLQAVFILYEREDSEDRLLWLEDIEQDWRSADFG